MENLRMCKICGGLFPEDRYFETFLPRTIKKFDLKDSRYEICTTCSFPYVHDGEHFNERFEASPEETREWRLKARREAYKRNPQPVKDATKRWRDKKKKAKAPDSTPCTDPTVAPEFRSDSPDATDQPAKKEILW